MIKFNVTPTERALIDEIVDRGLELAAKYEITYERRDMAMDIIACHCNGCPLDLEAFANAPDGDFGHDLFGIARFLNRTTGKIDAGKFDPRCSLPAMAH